MTHRSRPELLMLHAVRLLGFADPEAVAQRAGTSRPTVLAALAGWEHEGWVQHTLLADLDGWSLTEPGRVEDERRLAAERLAADPGGEVPAVYRAFLPLNSRLLRAVTDWQLVPDGSDRLSPNDHADQEWDARVLDELTALGRELAPLVDRLAVVLARFDGFSSRFDTALARAGQGEHAWVDAAGIDSCHTVWFQLHEDLIATLGVDRGSEG